MPDKPSELKPCRAGICIQSDYPGSGQVMSPDWVTYNGETFYDRAALVEVARRAALELMRSIYGPSFVVEPDWCERVVTDYLAEQAGKDSE